LPVDFLRAQHDDAFSRKIVGQNQKRVMAHETFIAIVRPGSADQKYGGK
jgi:hypothetical protein